MIKGLFVVTNSLLPTLYYYRQALMNPLCPTGPSQKMVGKVSNSYLMLKLLS